MLRLKAQGVFNDSAFKKTTDILDVNPEFYTVWNYRRDIIVNHYMQSLGEEGLVDLFDKELLYNMAKFREFPKVYWIWNHRTWLLENHPRVNWENELLLVEKIHKLDPRNFHGWTYRRYIISHMEKDKDLTLQEFEYTTKMINANFSNFSALHNRTKLIPKLFERGLLINTTHAQFLTKELEYLHNAMYTDPDDQSVFIYLRWLLTSDIFVQNIPEEQYIEFLQQELETVKELNQLEKDDGKENSWCLQTVVTINQLIQGQTGEDKSEEITQCLKLLVDVDPLRRNRYIDLMKR